MKEGQTNHNFSEEAVTDTPVSTTKLDCLFPTLNAFEESGSPLAFDGPAIECIFFGNLASPLVEMDWSAA